MALITVNDVQIKGLTVEVKSLTVSRKQLTLSLMRQFIDESIIDEDHMLLKGVPWGFINYFWGNDKEKTPEDFVHLIWQKGTELRRCVLSKKYRTYQIEEAIRSYNRSIQDNNLMRQDFSRRLDEENQKLKRIKENPEQWHFYNKDNLEKEKQSLENRLIQFSQDAAEYEENILTLRNFINNEIPKYHALIQSMKDLPHFFIAV